VVLEAVRRIDGHVLRPVASVHAGIAFRTRMLLAMVTYCYAAGIYGSQDIEVVMREDATFRFLCGNEFPGWKAIRRFRSYNRDAIQRCLEETLRGATQLPNRREAAAPPGQKSTHPDRQEGWIQEQFALEAEERIERAMWIDSMALDDW
jgi:hypothetical protein